MARGVRLRRRKIIRVSPEPRRWLYAWQFVRGVLFAQFILFATWNNSGYSYLGWVSGAPHFTALMAVAGISLLIGYLVLIRVAYVALGYPGIFSASVLLAMVMLIGSQLGLIELDKLTRHVEFWMFIVASILSIGVGWAKYQQRISGQRDVLKTPP